MVSVLVAWPFLLQQIAPLHQMTRAPFQHSSHSPSLASEKFSPLHQLQIQQTFQLQAARSQCESLHQWHPSLELEEQALQPNIIENKHKPQLGRKTRFVPLVGDRRSLCTDEGSSRTQQKQARLCLHRAESQPPNDAKTRHQRKLRSREK